jgi:membrane protein YdbS with pleckstrin-like domain
VGGRGLSTPAPGLPDSKTVAASEPLLRARISLRSFAALYFWLALVAVVAVVAWVAGFGLRMPWPAVAIIAAGLVPLLVGFLYTWLVSVSTEYRVFPESLEVESGLIARRIDNILLFRVRDLGFRQSVLGRLLGVGDVILTSTDHSTPHLVLRGVSDPRRLYQTLRELIAKSQATRRTMIVEEDVSRPDAD